MNKWNDRINKSPGAGVYKQFEKEEEELEYQDEEANPIPHEVLPPTTPFSNIDIPTLINQLMPLFLIGAGLLAVAAIGMLLKDKTKEDPKEQIPKVKTITKTIYKARTTEPKKITKKDPPKDKPEEIIEEEEIIE